MTCSAPRAGDRTRGAFAPVSLPGLREAGLPHSARPAPGEVTASSRAGHPCQGMPSVPALLAASTEATRASSRSIAACPAPPGTASAAEMPRSVHIRSSSPVLISSNEAFRSLTAPPEPR